MIDLLSFKNPESLPGIKREILEFASSENGYVSSNSDESPSSSRKTSDKKSNRFKLEKEPPEPVKERKYVRRPLVGYRDSSEDDEEPKKS